MRRERPVAALVEKQNEQRDGSDSNETKLTTGRR
jgi:hypothetical protein